MFFSIYYRAKLLHQFGGVASFLLPGGRVNYNGRNTNKSNLNLSPAPGETGTGGGGKCVEFKIYFLVCFRNDVN